MRVWVYERGMQHEGGGTVAICSTFERAVEWLRAEHGQAVTNAARMDQHNRDFWLRHLPEMREQYPDEDWPAEDPSGPWIVQPIEIEEERARFEDSIDYWTVRPWTVDAGPA